MDVKDTAAIVTGGASGLGLATSMALVDAGARVFVFDLPSASSGARLAGVRYISVDVSDAEQVGEAIREVRDQDLPLRAVVNCAGIGPSKRIVDRNGDTSDVDVFHRVVAINLVGTYNVMAHSAAAIARSEPLADGQRGVVINTASVAAFEGQVGQAAYSASKAGIVGLTLPAARDLASYGIRVNTIAPGIVETPMLASVSMEFRAGLAQSVTFPKRLGSPDEYSSLVMTLIAHDYINGETIRMDGALRMSAR